MSVNTIRCFALLCMMSATSAALSQGDVPKGFNTPIPESIMTPDTVETSIGKLRFFDGMPTEVGDRLAHQRVVLEDLQGDGGPGHRVASAQ